MSRIHLQDSYEKQLSGYPGVASQYKEKVIAHFTGKWRSFINKTIRNQEDIKMAKRGGYGGMGMMPGNMNNLMKQAQKMQKQMEETTKALEDKEYEATAGGGVVKVKINGKKEVTEVHLDEEVVDKDDIEMLEDLIMAAMNEAIRMQDEDQKNSMGKITGGLGGGLPF